MAGKTSFVVTAESREILLSRGARSSWLESVMGSIRDWDVVIFLFSKDT